MELTRVVFVATWICIGYTSAQVPYFGDCPDFDPMESFNVSKFMGIWYEAERYYQVYQMGGKCVSLEYVQDGDNFIKTISRQKNLVSGSFTETVAKSIEVKNGHASKMFFSYPYLPMDVSYTILDTDYDDYAVAWSCNALGFLSIRNAWILTRERHPPISVMEKAYSVFDTNGISKAFFYRTDQNNCPDVEELKNATISNIHDPTTRHHV